MEPQESEAVGQGGAQAAGAAATGGGAGRLGAMLRAAREARGLSLEALSERTRVRVPFLRALEEGRYDALPGPVYTRGFLKLYARAVGLDPAEVLAAWAREVFPPAAAEPVRGSPPPGTRPRPWWMPDPVLRSIEPRQRLRSAALATLVVVAVAVAGSWLLSAATRPPAAELAYRSGPPAPAAAQPVPSPPLEPSPSALASAPEPGREAAGGPAAPAAAETPSAGPPAAPGPAGPDGPPSVPAPASPLAAAGAPPASAPSPAPAGSSRAGSPLPEGGGVEVVAVVREAGWLEAYVDGRRVYSGTPRPGQTLRWEGQQLVSLRLGRAEGVDLTVDGKPLGPAGRGVTTRHFFASEAAR